MVWEAGTLLKFGCCLSYLSLNTPDIQQLDATHGPSNNAEEKRPSKAQATASKMSDGHPVTHTSCCCSGQHLGGPQGFSALQFFFSFCFFPPLNKGGSSQTECFGGIFLPALFLSTNSMLVNMEYNTRILTLQPVVLYSLLAIAQPGVAQELPSASLTLS